ncbi:MAG TPA: hypothetical protein EYG98_03840 [Sulfurovum sp.]|nr:hypothetical protein [Sulfurovum sp.]
MKDNFKITAGLISVGVYLLLVFLVFYYFNYRSADKPIHYVKKNSNYIAVSLASAEKSPEQKSKPKPKSKPKQKVKKAKKIRNITAPKSKPIKPVKKAKKPVKKIKTKDLFASVASTKKTNPVKDTPKKSNTQNEKSATQRISDSLKKPNNSDKGVEDRYFATIEEKLKGWPAQANFAGEQISIQIKVYSSGSFEFKVQRLSANTEFNEELIAYLKQLQQIGFDGHSNARAYEIEVEFIATE